MDVNIRKVAYRHRVGVVELSKRLGVTRQTVKAAMDRGDGISIRKLQEIADAIGCNPLEFFDVEVGQQGAATPEPVTPTPFVALVRTEQMETLNFNSLEALARWVETQTRQEKPTDE